jgi:UPF0042 nucleotide-binding protein
VTQIAVVSGLSGAGRSVAAGALQDLGWFVIDNLPLALVPKVAELARSGSDGYRRVALVMGGHDEEVSNEVEQLRSGALDVRSIFLEASTEVLIRRYESTKRLHPITEDGAGTELGLIDAIELERRRLEPARAAADLVIDTSGLNPHQLRDRIRNEFESVDGDHSMRVTLQSFGFKHGVPIDVDLMFDCRFLPNPYWDEALRPLRGTDDEIEAFVTDNPAAKRFLVDLEQMLGHLLPEYEAEGKSYLTIAFGCTGGHHRSVAVAERISRALEAEGWTPRVSHRDIDR